MADCYNHICPFRVNETSNYNRCECVACPNCDDGIITLTSDHTLTPKETERIVKRLWIT